MNVTEYAVHRLTEPHTIQVEGHTTEWVPLLLWLRQRITEMTKRSWGAGGQGTPINDDAYELEVSISKRLAWLRGIVGMTTAGEICSDTSEVWSKLKAERQGGRLDDQTWDEVCAEFPKWVALIEGEQDKNRKMELVVPCPRCEQRWTVDETGSRVSAVVVEFGEGVTPIAECRTRDCGAIWLGWSDIASLGFTVGANSDIAVLEACGIDTPKVLVERIS